MDKGKVACELCRDAGGKILWESSECRVVRVAENGYPGFCRVIWNAHVREMTDLDPTSRGSLMNIVFAVESVIRTHFSPHKINLASFGNMTPHLHWHVIPRWIDDPHFPEPIWGKIHQTTSGKRSEISDETLILAISRQLSSGEAHG